MDTVRSDRKGTLLHRTVARPVGRPDDDLADVPGPLHQPERFGHIAAGKDPVRQGHQLAVGEQLHDLAQQSRRQFPVLAEQLVDVDAEAAVCGMAIELHRGATLAVAHLEQSDFYDPALARLVWIAAEPPDLLTETIDERLDRIARRAGVYRSRLWQLCRAPRIADVDTRLHYVRRLKAAAEKRRVLLALAEELAAA